MEDPMNAPELVSPHSPPRPESGRGSRKTGPDEFDLVRAARVDSSILFTGATGAADAERIARHIHGLSGWRWGQFVVVDCGWPDSLLEQLFEILRPHPEAVIAAEPQARLLQAGTIFLRDIGKLLPALQVRLADALAGASAPGGQTRSRWRVMASTSESLLRRVAEGTFDDRLFYRLNMLHLVLPPDQPD
jgi:DNA-binding NtrC family response regulator